MKRSTYITLALFAGLGLTACKKEFLNTPSPSEFTEETVYSSAAYTEFAINGIYSLLTQDQMYSARLPLNYATNSDIEIAGANATTYKENSTRGLSNYAGTPDNSSITREWNMMYKLIERANLAVEGIRQSPVMATADSTKMKGYMAEALTLRALTYFELIKNWGDVPYKAEPTKSDLSNVFLPVSDRDEIYDKLLADLQEADNMSSWVGSGNYGTVERITKGFIKGLTARIALFRGGYSIRNKQGWPTERGANWRQYYELARTKCQEIMANGKHQLNPDYQNIWKKLNSMELDQTYFENLFEVANGLGRSGEMGYTIGVRFMPNKKYGFGNNANVVNTTPYYFYSFDQKDLRRDYTVAYYTYSNSAGEAKEVFVSNPLSFTFAKWDQRMMGDKWKALNLAASGKFGYGINWSIMRYSDVLLMFAEAENALNGGPTAAAKDALKKVRSRAFAAGDRAQKVEVYVNNLAGEQDFFNAIVNERAWEFGGEAVRKYDLIRWNLLEAKIQEQRNVLKQMMAGTGAYSTLPKNLFYKYDANNETLDKTSFNFYEDKGSADIAGYTKVAWLAGYSDANKTSYTQQIDLFSSGLNEKVPNRHLYPYPGTVVAESQGLLKNAYGF
ncbi:RagB/SusD family nutrient uptake outer membrane protein [Paraflavisolibacter sp. H34]|uniref:RagB/SusD family nutrient uptake outer membrane protein n=1 Tax=Huijunlia imazamoxiresistens TaxID=3127457 RepID=UPI00301ADC38